MNFKAEMQKIETRQKWAKRVEKAVKMVYGAMLAVLIVGFVYALLMVGGE